MKERERFEGSYTVDPDSGCWLWSRSLDTFGAGRMRYQGRLMQAHRVSLLLAGVELDPKREISPSCGRRHCVNPDHLRQVQRVDNPSRSLTYLSPTRRVSVGRKQDR